MKLQNLPLLLFAIGLFACAETESDRVTENFNFEWEFHYADTLDFDIQHLKNVDWTSVQLPHDYSIEGGFQELLPISETGDAEKVVSDNANNLPTGVESVRYEGYRRTASSTGFVAGGIGWYRKTFDVPKSDAGKAIFIEFDGVYCNSTVWINNQLLGTRPSGYVGFSYNLSPYLKFGAKNTIVVKVDHTNYADNRWYSGSGIYRKVSLVKKSPIHIPQWATKIEIADANAKKALIKVRTTVQNSAGDEDIEIVASVFSPENELLQEKSIQTTTKESNQFSFSFQIDNPLLWNLDTPHLYNLKIALKQGDDQIDHDVQRFGIRKYDYVADKGFLLNDEGVKLKGVNLHQDAGNLGIAVPKKEWEYRVKELKKIGCNAIRTAHHPFSSDFLDVCDEQGMVVIAEFFDEWTIPKGKSATKLGANDAPKAYSNNYTRFFSKWAEKDLKDVIHRDYNHPSIWAWSIGNEIEWTYGYYKQTYDKVNGKQLYYKFEPNYDSITNLKAFNMLKPDVDSLVVIARQLNDWVKEMDPNRPTTMGCVMPVVGMVSGLAQVLDVYGFNYRAPEYKNAIEAYPNLKLYGSENWGAWSEWKAVLDNPRVGGIFAWTGMAYLGEAGPFPRRGLNISFFDFASFKTPRGHFFECLWKDDPKVYIGTTSLKESEYDYNEQTGWSLNLSTEWLRRWDWYDIYNTWNYKVGEKVVVQGYTNCETAELFINGKSFGKQKVADNDDRVIKWLVPFEAGEAKIVGYNNGTKVDEYALKTAGDVAKLSLSSSCTTLKADGEDIAHIMVELKDENGIIVPDKDATVQFTIEGDADLIAVDNGSQYNVEHPKGNTITTNFGKALGIIQSGKKTGTVIITAKAKGLDDVQIKLEIL